MAGAVLLPVADKPQAHRGLLYRRGLRYILSALSYSHLFI